MKSILLSTLLILSVSFAWSQNIETATVKWNSTQVLDVASGNWTEELTSITSNGSSSLVWKNQDGSIRKSFQVIEIIGEWSNVNTDGRIQYEVTDGQFSATLSIRKQGSDIKILLAVASDAPETKELTIQSIQLL